jgi:small subunit ribosomal protein S16
MPVKIRLARRGRKKAAMYDIVVADSKAPRDGRFIQKLGIYNPNTNPATINFDEGKAFDWVMKGAQPTETVKAMLSYKGILFKKHLQVGVAKGAITQEQADARFNEWKESKETKIQGKREQLSQKKADVAKAAFAAEQKAGPKPCAKEPKMLPKQLPRQLKKPLRLKAPTQKLPLLLKKPRLNSASAMNIDACYQLGYIVRTHGVKGQVVAFFDVDYPEDYEELESVFLQISGKLVPFFIESLDLQPDGRILLKLEDVDSIVEAEKLKSVPLYLPLNTLPELGEDQFYFHDVIVIP